MTERTDDSAIPPRRVAVVGMDGQRAVVATEAIPAGEVVLLVTGVTTRQPSRRTIEIGEDEHVDIPADLDLERIVAEHPWQFLNHGCDPNVRLVARAMVAVRPIAAGDEIRFDYNTTEADMAAPFSCRCGASGCGGRRVAGFLHLTDEEKAARLPLLSDALRARAAREAESARTAGRE